jgi:hypothetical protein
VIIGHHHPHDLAFGHLGALELAGQPRFVPQSWCLENHEHVGLSDQVEDEVSMNDTKKLLGQTACLRHEHARHQDHPPQAGRTPRITLRLSTSEFAGLFG